MKHSSTEKIRQNTIGFVYAAVDNFDLTGKFLKNYFVEKFVKCTIFDHINFTNKMRKSFY